MTLPPKSRRSMPGVDPERNWDPRSRGVIPPEILVQIGKGPYGGRLLAKAQIRLRHRKYRYLAWRDGSKKCEFYLGTIKIHAPQRSSPAERPSPAPRSGAGPRKRGKK